ncbi:hypothetical protein JQ615_37835 [Bradyrhizobium jicamae]|uniref:Uncharacterized protein n=1 Tax=Bradyrhizobium jicamae TaxID=280332 RepID=A0ABS5FWG0_9BRAD|nr:hypothetical protein [Bradyrhizobium jicamae]MBR0801132.1 hypothetical protein [Bradyrhizobium jicamae]
MHWWYYAGAAIVIIAWVGIVARARRSKADALHDADVNRRIDERLDGVDIRRRKNDSGLAKMVEIPPEVAQQFVAEMQAYHSERDTLRRDEITFRTRELLLQHLPTGANLRLSDVEQIFERLKSQA